MAETLHGGLIAHTGAGLLLLGQSGSGKSRLMAEMMLHGARLVADDQVELSEQSGMVMGGAPKTLSNILELRGVGIIRVNEIVPRHVVHLAVELGENDPERLPEPATISLLGRAIPLLKVSKNVSAAVLLLYVKAMQEGRILPTDWRPTA